MIHSSAVSLPRDSAPDRLAMKIFLLFLTAIFAMSSVAQVPSLTLHYYSKTCPSVLDIVKREMAEAVAAERRMAASVLRLHFHDCFVQGCDGSVLLDDTEIIVSEKTAIPNIKSLRGFEVVDKIKAAIEAECPQVVSCADILAIAARDAVVLSGGPCWDVPLGRKDSITANPAGANLQIPMPKQDLGTLLSKFYAQGLSLTDMVALLGAHTIGLAQCVNWRDRIYGEFLDTVGLNPVSHGYLYYLKTLCPETGSDDTAAPMDNITPTFFDNSFYQILLRGEGLLHSDQELYSSLLSADTKPLVIEYALDMLFFFKHFSEAMVKMGNITTSARGEVRKNCRLVNANVEE